ncbi:leishmanolysin-related zinc metalloendopeptidase [Ruegeria lacuscaerulensis]|uniref:leishmanolysin-related zinc metalloendopeptidase n=1 Tax=Ruegeria lacuscaerulensis TaxID=55218 RepID=UPI00147CE53B|nr:leishmanolysin-related zinc metalloendopeptidase [Ruegeria lacuscaerulensis]
MPSENSGNFLDYVKSSGAGASRLHESENNKQSIGTLSGDLLMIDESAAARGSKGPPAGIGGGGETETEVVTDTYITGQGDGIDDSLQYNIEVRFVGDWPEDLKSVFIASANYLASLVDGDIEDAVDGEGNLYDDLVIMADLDAIDGEGGVLGQAGPTAIRSDTGLPALGEMTFDEADALAYHDAGQFDDIVLHEMMHVMGLGTLWDYYGLVSTVVDDNGTRRPTDDIVTSVYTGDAANSAYVGYFTEDDFLFVETDGGSGTAGGHWDEEEYQDELMTGYIGYVADDGSYDATNYLSDWSVASLEDLGYVLAEGAAGIENEIALA